MRRALLTLACLASSMAPALAQSSPGGPAAHRMLFAPTARAIPAGAWRLGLTEVLIPNVSTGLGGGVSLGAGVLVGPEPVNAGITFVEPKVTVVDRPGLDVALGVTAQLNPRGDRDASLFPYAVATMGAADAPGTFAATVGVGGRLNVRRPYDPWVAYDWGPSDIDYQLPPNTHRLYAVAAPTAFVGAELRASSRVTVLLEAMALPDQSVSRGGIALPLCEACDDTAVQELELYRDQVTYDLTLGTAFRYATRRVAVDAGIAAIRDAEVGTPPIFEPAPWLNLTVGLAK